MCSTATGATKSQSLEGRRPRKEAWEKYRDAEVALYVHVFGPSQGADNVRASLLVDLAGRRQQECSPPE
jgi:hypothetical protein